MIRSLGGVPARWHFRAARDVTAGERVTTAVLFEVASAQGNVGLSSGVSSPEQSPIVKAVLMVDMWVGRLTIILVLALVRGAV